MTDTTTLAPCPFCGSNQTAAPHDTHRPGCYFLVLASVKASPDADVSWATDLIAAWNRRAPAPASHEALTTALAACRDAFPVPASGSAAEFEWQGAMTDPLGVPAYVRACAAPPAQEARVPLSSQECRDMLEEVDHYNFAIDLIRAVEKHHGITAAQKETP